MADLVTFSGVENLAGADDKSDTFIFGEGGLVSGKIDGGTGGGDTLDYKAKSTGVAVNLFERRGLLGLAAAWPTALPESTISSAARAPTPSPATRVPISSAAGPETT